MRNCKTEFLEETNGKEIMCCDIKLGEGLVNNIYLKKGYTSEEYDVFLRCIDFEYDGGFGSQNLYGYIWYKDGTWSERGEYDGSEWWEYKECPETPEYLG